MKTLLLVEDTLALAEEISDILRLEGFLVIVTENATQALERLTRMKPDLIVTDLLMPVMDGFQFIERVRQDPALNQIPIVILSAKASVDDRARGFAAGADAFVQKPTKARDLITSINLLLNAPRSVV